MTGTQDQSQERLRRMAIAGLGLSAVSPVVVVIMLFELVEVPLPIPIACWVAGLALSIVAARRGTHRRLALAGIVVSGVTLAAIPVVFAVLVIWWLLSGDLFSGF